MPPSFSEYPRAARLAGLPVAEVPLTGASFEVDLGGVAAAMRAGPSLVYLCSRNNPTGNPLDVPAVLDLAAEAGSGSWVAVDEAYWEFAGRTVLGELARRPNLIILRTMSKAFCLAGIRMGYALAGPQAIARLDRARMLFNVDALSAAVAMAALRDPAYVTGVVARVVAARERLTAGMADLPGVRPLPSATNFVLAEVPAPAVRVAGAMEERGVLVRHYPRSPELSRHLRITVGTPDEVDHCLKVLRDSLQSLAGR